MKIIFLTYINRSGSTFLSSELDKSKEVLSCPEADCLLNIFLTKPDKYIKPSQKTKIIQKILKDPKFKAWNIEIDTLNKLDFRQNCFQIFYQILDYYRLVQKPSADNVIYKAEGLFWTLSDKKLNYFFRENCQVISIVRDIRGIYNSQFKTKSPETGKIMSNNVIKTCLYWNAYIQKMILNPAVSKIEIKYEDLVQDYPISLDQLAIKLKIYNLLIKPGNDLYNRLPEKHKLIHGNISLPPIKSRINDWENTLSHKTIQQVEFISGKYLIIVGYSLKESVRLYPIFFFTLFQYFRYLIYRATKKISHFLIYTFNVITSKKIYY